MEDDRHDEKQPDIVCKVCGEKQFTLCEGYYYCDECGTKQELVRAIEVEEKLDFTEPRAKKLKIKALKTEAPQITSWECYNYILRGLVEELMGYGAKEELKLMTLQVWSAYLRHIEVAFFNKKQPELPKLGYRFYKRDIKTLYNHVREKRKRKRTRTNESVSTSREWRRNKRKLDESVYSAQSMTSTEMSQSASSMNTSSTGTTGRPIQLKFSTKARKRLKKFIPPKHIKAHELDSLGVLQCHKLQGTWKTVQNKLLEVDTVSLKQLYTILAIALNLIGDDIQLSDLVRFIAEGHLGTKHVLKYFPESLAERRDQLFEELDNSLTRDKCSDKLLREQIVYLAESINLREFRKPDIFKLCRRYITELSLPKEIATYVERLINILPPQMQTRSMHGYPPYEARAMAYIVFVLKLLFGLDGDKERQISEASQKVNVRLRECNENAQRPAPELFVWSEWVEFVEMRKVIVGQFHTSFARQFKQSLSPSQIFEELSEAQRFDQDPAAMDAAKTPNAKLSAMHSIFELLCGNNDLKADDSLKFVPTFTPAHSYFKCIRQHVQNSSAANEVHMPAFMDIDHEHRSMEPYICARELTEFFGEHNVQLKVASVACTANRQYVGIFRDSQENRAADFLAQTPDFTVSEEEWRKGIYVDCILDELAFQKELELYEKQYLKHLEAVARKRGVLQETAESAAQNQSLENGDNASGILSLHSIDVFSEQNMDPIENWQLSGPRRNLDDTDLFAHIVDDDQAVARDLSEVKQEVLHGDDTVLLLQTNWDCWSLLGSLACKREVHKRVLVDKLPRSFHWLLETCGQTIGVDWSAVYEQVLVLEMMFGYGIENLNEFKSCLRYKPHNPIKDLNILINSNREVW